MANFWMLSSLTLQVGDIQWNFSASSGDLIKLEWKPEDIFYQTADYQQKKIRKGYRGVITLEIFVWNSIFKADFLRMCMNAEYVRIVGTDPVFNPDLADYNLVFENLEVVEMYSENKYLLKAVAKIQQLLPNIPSIES
jgi:hypothetical protein